MRRWLRVGLIGCLSVMALVVVAGGLFVVTFDPNTQKDRIVEAVRRATGRDLVLAGPLRFAIGWSPTLEAEDAALSNRAGGARPEMATVARLRASVALMPLLSGRIEIETVTLDRPDILLEMDAQGIGNWQFQRPATDVRAPESQAAGGAVHERMAVVLHRLVVVNGRVTWRNEASGRATVVDVPRATLTLGHGDDRLVADAVLSGQPAHVDATMVLDGAGPWPIKAALDAAGAHVALAGTVALPLNEQSYCGRVDAEAPDLSALAQLVKLQGMPALHDVRLGLTMGGDQSVPQDLTLHVGASDLGDVWPTAQIGQFDLSVPGLGQPGRVTAEGSLGGAPWRLSSGLVLNPHAVALRAFSLAAGGGDLAGDVAFVQSERWALRGTVVSQRLDADWLRALPRAAAAAPAASPSASATPPAAAPARVFSDAPLPWGRLRVADADLQFTLAVLRAGGADYRGIAGHVVLADGAMRLDPVVVQGPDGRIDASLVLDASQPEPPIALALRSAGYALSPVLQSAGLPGGSNAAIEMDVALRTAGLSPHALAAGLDGHAGVAMVDGAVANAALSAAVGGFLPPTYRIEPGGSTAVRCLALRLDARAGMVDLSGLRLDTARLELEGGGTVDLADETLALRLRPTVRVGGAGVLAPVQVTGALRRPSAELDSQGVGGRSGIVIGGAAPAEDCAAALAMARDGRAGRLPAAAAIKATKPADLLRSLLR